MNELLAVVVSRGVIIVVAAGFAITISNGLIFIVGRGLYRRSLRKHQKLATDERAEKRRQDVQTGKLLSEMVLRKFRTDTDGDPICPHCGHWTRNRENIQERGFPFHWWLCKCRKEHCGFEWIMIGKDENVYACCSVISNFVASHIAKDFKKCPQKAVGCYDCPYPINKATVQYPDGCNLCDEHFWLREIKQK